MVWLLDVQDEVPGLSSGTPGTPLLKFVTHSQFYVGSLGRMLRLLLAATFDPSCSESDMARIRPRDLRVANRSPPFKFFRHDFCENQPGENGLLFSEGVQVKRDSTRKNRWKKKPKER